ncbi:hypothetical protein CON11_27630 [Priestia megaterium]|nr:hypothetical protein CON11_27630 [Priestia megaterium]
MYIAYILKVEKTTPSKGVPKICFMVTRNMGNVQFKNRKNLPFGEGGRILLLLEFYLNGFYEMMLHSILNSLLILLCIIHFININPTDSQFLCMEYT